MFFDTSSHTLTVSILYYLHIIKIPLTDYLSSKRYLAQSLLLSFLDNLIFYLLVFFTKKKAANQIHPNASAKVKNTTFTPAMDACIGSAPCCP